jgi:hypothetical protein
MSTPASPRRARAQLAADVRHLRRDQPAVEVDVDENAGPPTAEQLRSQALSLDPWTGSACGVR